MSGRTPIRYAIGWELVFIFFFLVPSSFLMELPVFMTRKLESIMLIFIYHLE